MPHIFMPEVAMADQAQLSKPQASVPVVVKKYANRRLYNTETSSYITQDNLADMVKAGRDFVVYDARSGEDITRGVLTQIIVDAESKGTSMLPTPFLRHLIGFYGDSLQSVVPRYLEQAMGAFARQQQQMRQAYQQAMTPFLPFGIEQNMAMMERAMSMFSPFFRPPGGDKAEAAGPSTPSAPSPMSESDLSVVARLQGEIDALRRALDAARVDQGDAGQACTDQAVADQLTTGAVTTKAVTTGPAKAEPATIGPAATESVTAGPTATGQPPAKQAGVKQAGARQGGAKPAGVKQAATPTPADTAAVPATAPTATPGTTSVPEATE